MIKSSKWDAIAFQLEVEVSMKIKRQKHLDELLTIFKHQNQYHLIFRWAEGGNLMDLWTIHMKQPKINHGLICWVAEQCHGLACGLEEIHGTRISQEETENILKSASPNFSNSLTQTQHPTVNLANTPQDQDYGRHGNIKPRNILWFSEDANQFGHGMLKISGIGLPTFQSTTKRCFPRDIVGCTWTYG